MINLLPSSEKKIILFEKKKKIVIILYFYLFLFIFLSGLFLICFDFYLRFQIKKETLLLEEKQKTSYQLKVKNLKKEIIEANKFLTWIENYYQEKIYPSQVFEKLSEILPKEIYLTSFSFNQLKEEEKEVLKISLSGYSPTRESLFELKKRLEGVEIFENVNFPVSAWVKAKDINFSVSFNLKK